MINLSTTAKLRLQENQKVLFKAEFTLDKKYGRNANIPSQVTTLHGDDVMGDTATITDATTSSGSFDIGSAIIGSFNLTLNNFDDRFSLYDFTDATMLIYVGVPLVDNVTDEDNPNQVEWVTKGYYTVDKPTSIGNTIPLTMLDNMSKFERAFKDVNGIGDNATLGTYITEICRVCGVRLDSTVPHPEWTVSKKPTDDGITCLDIIGYIAQINGCYARINHRGDLYFGWYNSSEFSKDTGDKIDGGTFLTKTTPYSDGANIDGGSFDHSAVSYVDIDGIQRIRYANPTTGYNGGSFSWGNYAIVQAFQSFSVGTDILKITGIEFVIENLDEKSQVDSNTYLYDASGNVPDTATDERKANAREYCLSIQDNKILARLNQKTACMGYIAGKIVGLSFTPFNITTLSNPQYEAGDPVRLISVKGDVYDSYITSLSYPLNGYETLNCDAQTPNEQNSRQSSPLSTAIAEVKNDTVKKLSAYDEAVHRLTQLSANALGFYSSTVVQADGSVIEYMHDKPTYAGSLNAYMISSTGFFIQQRAKVTDAWTSTGGVDMSANAVFKTLVAEGIDANKINVSNLVVGNNVTMGANARIGWSKVGIVGDGKPIMPTYTEIGSTYITTNTITANNLTAGNVNCVSTDTSGKTTKTTISGGKIYTENIDVECDIELKKERDIYCSNYKLSKTTQIDKFIDFYDDVRIGEKFRQDGDGTKGALHSKGSIWIYSTDEFAIEGWNGGGRQSSSGVKVQWNYPSDKRLKKNIKSLAKDTVRKFFAKVNPVSFKFNFEEKEKDAFGVIAQEMEVLMPELGFNDEHIVIGKKSDYLMVDYDQFHGWELAGIKDLYNIVQNQQEQINELKQEIIMLKQELNKK